MREKEEGLYLKALVKWGYSSQIGMFVEEIGEVLQAINKFGRGCATKEEVAQELVDLQIMLNQMRLSFNINEYLWEKIKSQKLKRLEEILKECGSQKKSSGRS